MVRTRNVNERKVSLRLELEAYVVAWNTVLKDVVRSMDVITLLRNAHPAYRGVYAASMRDNGLLGIEEAKEFIKIVGLASR